mmetsp:Transcript_24632/g.70307  ORF Transcript_24632/g.70307 Transcript_24632/m.70307 type:complete len:271 (-) Transcript_24632:671-1483(-)
MVCVRGSDDGHLAGVHVPPLLRVRRRRGHEIRHVAEEDREVLGPRLSNDPLVHVERHPRHELGVQQLGHQGAHPAIAADDHPGALQPLPHLARHVDALCALVLLPLLQVSAEVLPQPGEQRRARHAHACDGEQQLCLLRRKDADLPGDAEDDEGELAGLAHEEADLLGIREAQARGLADRRGHQGLAQEKAGDRAGDEQRPRQHQAQVDAEANGDEEEAEQVLADGRDGHLHRLAIRRLGEGDARHESTERVRQAEDLEHVAHPQHSEER